MAKSARRSRDDEEDDRPRRRATRVEDDDSDEPPRRGGRRDDGIPPGTPRVYIHRKCGRATRMPAEIIREYLDNPFAFGHQTVCSNCEKDVPWKNCEWEETGENLLDYFEDMQARTLLAGDDPRENEAGKGMIYATTIAGFVIGAGGGALIGSQWGSWFLGLLIGSVLGIGIGIVQWFREKQAYEQIKEDYDRQLFKKFYARHPDEKRRKKGNRGRPDDNE